MLNIQLQGDQQLVEKFGHAGEGAKRELAKTITTLVLKLESKIKNEKLSGQVLHVVSGDLRRSIHSVLPVEVGATSVTGRVGQSGDVKYGAIHEFGGKTQAHVIEAKGKALAFQWKGDQVFFKKVNHPGSVMPERSYMRSALAEMAPEARTEMQAAARRVVV